MPTNEQIEYALALLARLVDAEERKAKALEDIEFNTRDKT